MNVRSLAIAAIALCVTARGQTSAPASEGTSLEAARRDLRALPATERSQDLLGKSSGLGSASLPTLTLPGEGNIPQSKPESNAPPSPTWLQDALKQADSERSQRRSLQDPAFAREQANGYKPLQAPDPFGQYLEQWLSPRDLELLRPDIRKNADQKTKSQLDQAQPLMDVPSGSDSQLGQGLPSILPMTRNPYLDEPVASPSTSSLYSFAPQTPPGLQQSDRTRAPATLPLSSTSTTTNSPRPATPGHPALMPAEAVPASPIVPIVDDRKYFPQLRRF